MYRNLLRRLRAFYREELAVTTTEYAVMLAMIVLVCLMAIRVTGSQIGGAWEDNATDVGNALGD
ncbi:MAG: Flp family type IVb pilin [Planctomycetota bacterium]